ncbi:MAG: thymidylate synthase [Ectothiorhodospiraceae bacterium]|nr:thymidylate synthase [Ectothiorhodospiraceae bacterium]
MQQFLSPEPKVHLEKAFTTPFKNVIATARTCYSSKGIIQDSDVDLERFTPLAKSIFEAGHHTTFQHAQFQFRLENISRQFIWSFLHSHQFYNSEQVSQRYVEVKPGNYAVPPLEGEAKSLYVNTSEKLFERYRKLINMLHDPVAVEYFGVFPARTRFAEKYQNPIKKKAMEIARYVLPVSMFAYMYHTISGISLLRYYRLANQMDTPLEQRIVLQKMVDAMLAHDPGYEAVLQQPLDAEAYPEFDALSGNGVPPKTAEFLSEFDASLDGYTSKLIDYKVNAEAVLADAVREVLAKTKAELPDGEAIEMVLDPGKNKLLGESMVLTTHAKVSRAMHHVHYTFRRKISHTADSQDQRHRMVPGSRPVLSAHMTDEPDYITPILVKARPEIEEYYHESMEIAWDAFAKLRSLGVSSEHAMYVLPNALSVRFTESSDLLHLHHKHAMRLCYNAQEEIWQSSLDEARQIRQVHPQIGKYLLPPCTIRDYAGLRPVCPEGKRYCGVKVWKIDLDEYERVI